MTLDLSSLRKAIDAFERSLRVSRNQNVMANLDEDARDTIKAGVIQNFEVAYESCWKYMQRWLKENASAEEAEFPRTRKELFRVAARYDLIKDPTLWFDYSDARNLTSHTYNEEKAESVYESAKGFIVDARYLLERLEKAK